MISPENSPHKDGSTWEQAMTVIAGITIILIVLIGAVTTPEIFGATFISGTPASISAETTQTPSPVAEPDFDVATLPLLNDAIAAVSTPQPTESTTSPPKKRTPRATSTPEWPDINVIGRSVEERSIYIYSFGQGDNEITLVGGIHGGYEWNSIILAYAVIDHFSENRAMIPDTMTLHVIPNANPDGTFATLEQEGVIDKPSWMPGDDLLKPGRFNANGVDLNRNWDCNWQQATQWIYGYLPEAGGRKPFSEPETLALKAHFERGNQVAAIFWHSRGGEVYKSGCDEDVFEPSAELATIYADAADYIVRDETALYPVTGEATNWLSTIGVPAVTVEMETRTQTELDRNLDAIQAMLDYYR